MNDENERSVAGEPMAWAVVLSDGQPYARRDFRWEAQAIADALPANEGATVVPLYPQPSLTGAEREAVELGIELLVIREDDLPSKTGKFSGAAATLRGLLERME